MQSQREANVQYAEDQSCFSARCKDRLAPASSSRNWHNTFKESVLGFGSSIPHVREAGCSDL